MATKDRTSLQAGFDASGAIETNTSNLVSAADIVTQLDHISDSSFSRLDDELIRYAPPSAVSGTNAISLTLSNNYPTSYNANIPIFFRPVNNNTGTPTINVNSIGAVNVYDLDQNQQTAADTFETNKGYIVRWDTDADGGGTDGFIIIDVATSAGTTGAKISGTPVDDALAIWTGSDTIEGSPVMRYIQTPNDGLISNTSDGSDDESFYIGAGGAYSVNGSRGAFIFLHGNEATNTGQLRIESGNVTGGNVEIAAGAALRMVFLQAGGVDVYGNLHPSTDLGHDLGGTSNRWDNVYGEVLTLNSDTDQNIMLWQRAGANLAQVHLDEASDIVTIQANAGYDLLLRGNAAGGISLDANINLIDDVLPGADETYDLGSTSLAWQDLFAKRISFDDGSNYLDDYEEGTFTPSLEFGGGSTGITYDDQEGVYTKKGQEVTGSIRIELTNKGSSTGAAEIVSLPFTPRSDFTGTSIAGGAGISRFQTITFADVPQADVRTTGINLTEVTTGGSVTTITDANFSNTSQFVLYFEYRTDS